MSDKKLLLDALKCLAVERAPWVPFVGVHGGAIQNLEALDYLQSADSIVAGLSKAFEMYKPDGLPIYFDLQMEAEILGCQIQYAKKSPPSVCSHPLSEAEGKTLADLPAFDPKSGRLPIAYEATSKMSQLYGDKVALYGLLTGPFTLALHLRGDEIFLDMYDDEDYVAELMQYCMQIEMQVAREYIKAGADVIALVDPMVSQISPDHFEEFVKPYVDPICEEVRKLGKFSSLFVCGNATRNLEIMCSCACDNISVDENVDLTKLRDIALASNKSFGGNIKLTTTLLLGDELESQRDAIRCIDEGGLKGFVLAPGCDLPYDTPAKNLIAVADVATDAYNQQIARTKISADVKKDSYDDVVLPDYENYDKIIVDVVTLDSAACPPCFYMLKSVENAVNEGNINAEVHERKITNREGLGFMSKLGVTAIPTICINGKPMFASIIPDKNTLIDELVKSKK